MLIRDILNLEELPSPSPDEVSAINECYCRLRENPETIATWDYRPGFFPYPYYNDDFELIIDVFMKIAYDNCDYMREVKNGSIPPHTKPFDYQKWHEVRRITYSMARAERFCDGAYEVRFHDGTIEKIIKMLNELFNGPVLPSANKRKFINNNSFE